MILQLKIIIDDLLLQKALYMHRAVLADHVMFKEAIEAFRFVGGMVTIPQRNESRHAYLLSTFELEKEHTNVRFILRATEKAILPGARASVILPVEFTGLLTFPYGSHLAGIAASAILTLASLHAVTSPRDPYLSMGALNDQDKIDLAVQSSFLVAGPGATTTKLSNQWQSSVMQDTSHIVKHLMEVEYKDYEKLMQAIRLFQLAIQIKRDDFDLAFSLLVAHIEVMATLSITRGTDSNKRAVKYSPAEEKIEKYCRESGDSELKGWFSTTIKKQGALKARFVRYLQNNVSTELWESIRHPYQDISDIMQAYGAEDNSSFLTRKAWYEVYPAELDATQVENIFSDTYIYRSRFVHEGMPTPYMSPTNHTRYFDVLTTVEDNQISEKVLINFDALASIAKHCFMNSLNGDAED
jgi:hypothetical protein